MTTIKDGKDPVLPSWFWPANISPMVTSLLIGLLQWDPAHRLTAAEAIRHPWCQGLSYEEFKALPSREVFHTRSLNTVNIETVGTRSYHPIGNSRLSTVSENLTTPERSVENVGKIRNSPPSLLVPTSHNDFLGQYDWSSIQDQQRKKEAEALELYGRQIAHIKFSSDDSCNRVRQESTGNSDQNLIASDEHHQGNS